MKLSSQLFTILALTFLFSCSSESTIPDDPSTNDPNEETPEEDNLEAAPDFSLESLSGETISLNQYKDKVLVIFFFGHNCPPCVSVGPTIESDLHQAYSSETDFAIIGIDVWNGNNAQVESFQSKTNASYPLGLKGSGVGTAYGSGRDRLVVINKEGKIAFNGKQIAKNDLSDVRELLNSLL